MTRAASIPACLSFAVLIANVTPVEAQQQFSEIGKLHLSETRADPTTRSVLAFDADGDGDTDFLALRPTKSVLWIDTGSRRFGDETTARLPFPLSDPTTVAAGDLDGDADPDLVIGRGHLSAETTIVLLNDGKGVFRVASNTPIGKTPARRVLVFDVDGDGDLDVFIASGHDFFGKNGQSRLWLNDGKANFTDVTTTNLPRFDIATNGAANGDLDGDKDSDVVLVQAPARNASATSRVLQNDGSGKFSFVTGAFPSSAEHSNAVALSDVDGDGDLDAFIANEPRQSFGNWIGGDDALWLNDGKAKFARAPAGSIPSALAATRDCKFVDLDSDGLEDLVIARLSTRRQTEQDALWLRTANGKFVDRTSQISSLHERVARSLSVAAVPASAGAVPELYFGTEEARDLISFRDRTGQWTEGNAPTIPLERTETFALVIDDFDGDGDDDFVAGNFDADTLWLGSHPGVAYRRSSSGLPTQPTITTALASFDANADGRTDLLVGKYGIRNRLLLGTASGGLTDRTTFSLPTEQDATTAIAAADLDGDGDIDAIVANEPAFSRSGRNTLLSNDGRAVFADVSSGLPGRQDRSYAVATGDLDGDGLPEIVVGNLGAQNRVLANLGSMRFAEKHSLGMYSEATRAVALGDVDSDGNLDLVVGNSGGRNRLYLGDGRGAFVEAPNALPRSTDDTRAIVLADLDGDGDLDIYFGNASRNATGAVDRLLVGNGKGAFVDASARLPAGLALDSLAVDASDIDSDGDLDLVIGTTRETRVLLNLCSHAWSPYVALMGSAWRLEAAVAPGFATSSYYVLGFVGLDALKNPVAIPGRGILRLDPARSVTLPVIQVLVPGGIVSVPLALPPSSAAFVGKSVHAQMLTIPIAQPQNWRLGGLVVDRLIH